MPRAGGVFDRRFVIDVLADPVFVLHVRPRTMILEFKKPQKFCETILRPA